MIRLTGLPAILAAILVVWLGYVVVEVAEHVGAWPFG